MAQGRGSTITILNIRCKLYKSAFRDVNIPSSFTFDTLHDLLQLLFNWCDDHCHVFIAHNGKRICNSMSMIGLSESLEHRVPLSRYLTDIGDEIDYEYDFGSTWHVKIDVKNVERIRIPNKNQSTLIACMKVTNGRGKTVAEYSEDGEEIKYNRNEINQQIQDRFQPRQEQDDDDEEDEQDEQDEEGEDGDDNEVDNNNNNGDNNNNGNDDDDDDEDEGDEGEDDDNNDNQGGNRRKRQREREEVQEEQQQEEEDDDDDEEEDDDVQKTNYYEPPPRKKQRLNQNK